MNEHDREILRNGILQSVAPSGRTGLPAETIRNYASGWGFALTPAALDAELAYLEDKGLLASHASALSAALKRYTLTATGREYLEAANLI